MNDILAPIVLFVYNRPWHTKQTLEALSKNELADQSQLFIYADGPKPNANNEQLQKINEVRTLIREKQWCKEVQIIEQTKNIGIGNSEILGITEIVNKFDKIIVMEDDLVASPYFLKYMNNALFLYKDVEKVMHISGFMFPVKVKLPLTFFLILTSSWGWATWKRAWDNLNLNSSYLYEQIKNNQQLASFNYNNSIWGKLLQQNMETESSSIQNVEDMRNSDKWNWDICWYASVFLKNGFCLYPNKSLVRNIGHDNVGVHCKDAWWSAIYTKQKIVKKIEIEKVPLIESHTAKNAIKQFFNKLNRPPFFLRVKEKLKVILSIN